MEPKQPLSKILSAYQPKPRQRFYLKMERAPWNQQRKPFLSRTAGRPHFAWQMAVVAVLVLLALSLSIPAVRASLSAWLGLSIAPSNQMPAASVTLVAPRPAETSLPAAAGGFSTASGPVATAAGTDAAPSAAPLQTAVVSDQPAEIRQLSAQAGWNILTPARLPEGYAFQSAYFDANHQMVILTYLVTRPLPGAADPSLTASKTITLLQALRNDFVPLQVAPGAALEDAQVNGEPAVFAVGAWDTEFVKDDQDPNGGRMVSTWRGDLPVKNLYWQVGKIYLVLLTDDESVSQPELIDTADSIGGS